MANSSKVKKVFKAIGLSFLGLFTLFVIIGMLNMPDKENSNSVPVAVETSKSPDTKLPPKPDHPIVTEKIKEALPPNLSSLVKSAKEPELGKVQIETSIVDPRGGISGSLQAQQAIEICNAISLQGYNKVSVMEDNGTSFVLFGHPSYPEKTCSEV